MQLCLSTAFIFHVYSVAGCCGFRDTPIVHKRVLTLPTISVRFCVCACVADETHVRSVVAGWLEPEVSGGFIWDGWGSGDNNRNIHILIHAHTSFPINKSPAFHHTSPPCVSRGGWGLVVVAEGLQHGRHEGKLYF